MRGTVRIPIAASVVALITWLLLALFGASSAAAASESTRVSLAIDRSIAGSTTATWDESQGTLRQTRAHATPVAASRGDSIVDPTPEGSQSCGGRSGQNSDAVAIGRINADSLPDMVIGCPYNDGGVSDSGSILVFIRASDNSGWLAAVELVNPNKASAGNAECGRSVAIGDVNGDGKGDVAMGCPQRDTAADRGSAVTFARNVGDTNFDAGVEHSAPTPVTNEYCGHSVAIGNVSGVAGQGDVMFGCVGTSTSRGRIARVHWNGSSFDTATSFTYSAVANNDWCGASMVLGDVNGDGRSDLVYGCSGNNGRAVAQLSSGAGFGAEMVLLHTTPAASDQCGFKVAIADLDGDSDGDVVSTCSLDDPAARTNQGSAFVYSWGGASFSAGVNLVPSGANTNEECGSSLGVGDVDGDGRNDVVLGCTVATSGGVSTAGNVHVFLRSADGTTWTTGAYREHPFPTSTDLCAFSLAVGDVDGDGFADIAMGCPQIDIAAANAGGAIVLSGASPSVATTIAGAASSESCGGSMATGDFDGDGRADYVTGCPTYNSSRGRISVHVNNAGTAGYPTTLTLQPPSPLASDFCGMSVATGDVNGDGRDDILVGCTVRDQTVTNRGDMVVFTRNVANSGFDPGVPVVIAGGAANDNCGTSVALGDVDGDGYADAVMGCPYDDSAATDAGAVIVATRNASNDGFDPGQRLTLASAATTDRCGTSVAVGDLDGDRYADVVAGCPQRDVGVADTGAVAVFAGSGSGFGTGVIASSSTAMTTDQCGASVAIGDIDGDGGGDLVAGCPGDDTLQASGFTSAMGSAVVWLRGGGSYLLSTELDHPAPLTNDACGRSVGVGDLDGDGYDDVLIGCDNDSLTAPIVGTAGSVLAYPRNAANNGFDAPVTYTDTAPGSGDLCGMSMAVDDTNADGRSDVLIGCPGDNASDFGAVVFRPTSGTNLTGSTAKVVVTKRLNAVEPSRILTATISAQSIDNGTSAMTLELSVDGGSTWESATLGAPKTFATNGNDLRMRLTLPAHADPRRQRIVHDLTLDYTWSTPTFGTVATRTPLGLDRSDIVASSAMWDEEQRVLRQKRAHSVARMSTEIVKQRGTPGGSEYCGWGTETGDFNADGLPDLLMSCASNTSSSLHAIVHMRNATGYDAPIELVNPTPAAADTCGYSLDTGDVTGDGRDDVVMGCVGADATAPSRAEAGSAVLFVSTGATFNAGIEYFHSSVLTNDQCGFDVALGDVNGDGRDDLVHGCPLDDAGASNAGAAIVQLSTGTGFSATIARLANPAPVTYGGVGEQCGASVDVGDVDGDTYGDVVMGCRFENSSVAAAGSFVVYRGSAAGTFTYEGEYFAPTRVAADQCGENVAVADVDGNGRSDVVFTCPKSSVAGSLSGMAVMRLRNPANTGFVAGTPISSPYQAGDECGGWRGLALGDVDGNGGPDIMVGCNASDTAGTNSGAAYVHLLTSAGAVSGSFEVRSRLQTANDQCGLSVAVSADATGDGRPDVYVGCPVDATTAGSAGSVAVLDGLATSRTLVNPAPSVSDTCGGSIEAGDVNGDGLVDLVVGCSANGTGQGGTQTVVVYERDSANVGYLPGVELTHPSPVTDDLCGLAVAIDDVNGDGRDDILGGCPLRDTGQSNSGAVVLWMRNAANTGFRAGSEYANPTPQVNAGCGAALVGPNGSALGDINGDGRADIVYGCSGQTVTGNANGGMVVVRLRNAANSGFDAPISLPNPSPSPNEYCGVSVSIGDLDGDGYGDVVAGCSGSSSNAGSVLIWTWDNGGGAFVARAEQFPSGMATNDYCGRSIDTGDVDGNGRADIVFGCMGDQVGAVTNAGSAMVLTRNVTNTGFDAAVQLARPTSVNGATCGYSVSLGDTNGDGFDDVGFGCPVVNSSQGSAVLITRSSNGLTFDAAIERVTVNVAGAGQCGYSLALADIDRDGRSDLALGCPLDDDGATNAGTVQTFGSTSTGSAGGVSRLVETKRLNRGTAGTVTTATISQQHTANGAGAPTLQASADGGANWQAASWATPISFTDVGDDLRLRITLPASSNQKLVEVLHSLTVSYDYLDNVAPDVPTFVSPAAAGHVTDDTPALTATFTDANPLDSGTLQYEICTVTVSPAQTCTGQGGTPSGTGSTAAGILNGANGVWSPASSLAADATYYWRVRARDGSGVWSAWSASRSVIVDSLITVGPPTSSIPLGPIALGDDAVGSTTITIDSNDPQGYQLVAADQDASWGMQCDNVPICSTSTIPDRTATGAAPLAWTAGDAGTSGYVGVTVRDAGGVSNNRLGKWGNPNAAGWPELDFTNNLYVGLGTTTTVLHQVAGVAPSDSVVLAARVTAGGSGTPTPAGTYAGTITVTAVGL